jgi:hypothetical protein
MCRKKKINQVRREDGACTVHCMYQTQDMQYHCACNVDQKHDKTRMRNALAETKKSSTSAFQRLICSCNCDSQTPCMPCYFEEIPRTPLLCPYACAKKNICFLCTCTYCLGLWWLEVCCQCLLSISIVSLQKIGGFWFRQFEFFDLWGNINQRCSRSR